MNRLPRDVLEAIARAYYHVDTNQLARFCEAIRDEVPIDDARPEDKTARRFAAAMASYKGGGGKFSLVIFRKCQNALRAWLDGKVLERIMESHENIFPLPEENNKPTADGQLVAASAGDAIGA